MTPSNHRQAARQKDRRSSSPPCRPWWSALVLWVVLAPLSLFAPLAAADDVANVRLKAGRLKEPDLMPPWGTHLLEASLPEALAGRTIPVKKDGGKLLIDLEGRGRFPLRVSPSKTKVIDLGEREAPRPVILFNRLGRWYAGSASLVHGKRGKVAVQLLDVDLDGTFDGERDAIRFGKGVYRPVVAGELAQIGAQFHRYHVERDAESDRWRVSLQVEPRYAAASRTAQKTLSVLAGFRNGVGLSPVLENEKRSEACRLHVTYWKRNQFTGHDETPGRPGYTPEGARAGRSSSVSTNTDPPETIDRISRTVLHRQTCLGISRQGLGLAWDPGCCLWGGDIDSHALPAPIFVPGPGQTDVPVQCRRENPSPASFPRFYDLPRGYPISVTWKSIYALKNVDVRLWKTSRRDVEQVKGVVFTPERPYHSIRPSNGGSAFFVATSPLLSEQRYVAEFVGEHASLGTILYTWAFTTE